MQSEPQANIIVQIIDAVDVSYRKKILRLLPPLVRSETYRLGHHANDVPETDRVDLTPHEIEQLLIPKVEWLVRGIAWLILTLLPDFGGSRQGELTRRQIDLAHRILFLRGYRPENARQSHYEATADLSLPVSRYVEVESGQDEHKIPLLVENGSIIIQPGWVVALYLNEWFYMPGNLSAHLINKASLVTQGIALVGSTAIDGGFLGWIQVSIVNTSTKPFVLRDKGIICKVFFGWLGEYVDQPYAYASLSLAEHIKNE
ncbi:MAG: hypothetical protein IAE80_26405 [Anaerolinea sp.]|nr:hypothetical protein [Anaerolinea sp.]